MASSVIVPEDLKNLAVLAACMAEDKADCQNGANGIQLDLAKGMRIE
jgi:hypothetical protein